MMGLGASSGKHRARRRSASLCAFLCIAAMVAGNLSQSRAQGVTPESPEVKKLVNSALAFLEKNGDERLGGKCLLGLAFLKAGRTNHARVNEALAACRETMSANPPDGVLDVYSNGLAIIFLCELSSEAHRREIEWYLSRMKARQKPHGGWGYHDYATGDTSQTQYAALAYWEAHRRGFSLDGNSVENLADWIMRTQDPDGCWGYQAQVSTSAGLIPQSEKNPSMLSAGMGIAYICADLFGATFGQLSAEPRDEESSLPDALRPAGGQPDAAARHIRPQRTDIGKLGATIGGGHRWMEKNYEINFSIKVYYYLYGLERYKSFQETFEGTMDESPSWYNDGYKFLAGDQKEDGSWQGYCGAECDTAFATLFLLRSTKKSLRRGLGEGSLLSGRGLPSNLSRAKMRNGQLIVEQVHTKVDELLSMIDQKDEAVLDELARDPSQLVVEQVDEKSARRLQQLVRGGEPEVRLLAVRALGRSGNLDYVPSLLYALTDPDPRVVLEARNGLRFISRSFKGYGPPDEFTEQQRYDALDKWKNWYKSIRPAAILEE
jgi:HEAT repeats/Prenyltransferase and squalene oxidase repeat